MKYGLSLLTCCALFAAALQSKSNSPNFEPRIEAKYPGAVPSIHFTNRGVWLSGQKNDAIVRVDNPGDALLNGDLEFSAKAFQFSQHMAMEIQPHGNGEVIFRVEVPTEVPEAMVADLAATFQCTDGTSSSIHSQVTLHPPLTAKVEAVSGVSFPLREDQVVPIVRPALTSINLPGSSKFRVRIKNWSEQQKEVGLSVTGQDLELTPPSSRMQIAAGEDKIFELLLTPQKGTGFYHASVKSDGQNFQFSEDIAIAAVAEGEALAYAFDYDGDGFDDVILENQRLRCFVSPHAGGRSFAFVRKDTNTNAFDSVGGMRDNFTTRMEPAEMHGRPDSTTEKGLGLSNRPYSFETESAKGKRIEVKLEYEAPDIYPSGIHLKRNLTLLGDQDMLVETTTVTPHGIKKPQALVLESSVPYRVFGQPNYNQWFAEGRPALDFEAGKKIDLPPGLRFIGTRNRNTGETLTIMLLSKPREIQIVPEARSALFRFTYPNFKEANHPYTYLVGYSFSGQSPTTPQ